MKKASAAADQLIGEGSALVARHEQTLISGCGAFMRKIVDLDQRARRRVLTTSRRKPHCRSQRLDRRAATTATSTP